MPSIQRLKSVCNSIAQHSVSGLGYLIVNLRPACRAKRINTSITINLIDRERYPKELDRIIPLETAINSLYETFCDLLQKEGFAIGDITEMKMKFIFSSNQADNSCADCLAKIAHKSGKSYRYAVSCTGERYKELYEKELRNL
jgi:hypothetical protein